VSLREQEVSRHHAGPEALSATAAAARLEASLQVEWPGLRCEWISEVTSTNTVLSERARLVSVPALLVADSQTQGKGRLGRLWRSQPGASLTFSVSLPLASHDWSGLSLAIGVAIVESLGMDPGKPPKPELKLKWPNDIWLVDHEDSGRKLGGILVEGLTAADGVRVAVIGIGLNLLPLCAAGLSSGYASVYEIWPRDVPPTPETVLRCVAPAVLQGVRQFAKAGFASFETRFANHDLLRGKAVRSVAATGGGLQSAAVSLEGIAQGVDAKGALLVLTGRGVVSINSGEVSVRLGTDSPMDRETRPAERS
jgi:BirA family biotin operon repressor/biotin-[acetyl-CoA-carboxylase] ligase